MDIKYVVIEHSGNQSIILFPAWILHKEMLKIGKITSAGFIDLENKRCYGYSTSLKLKSNQKEDNLLLKLLLNKKEE